MSVWTHVTGQIRLNDLSMMRDPRDPNCRNVVKDVKKILGPISTFYKPNRKCILPMGSEGSLEYDIRQVKDDSNIARFVISIWGDLRDYDAEDAKEIEKWFRELKERFENEETYMYFRDAVLKVETEDENNTATILYYVPENDEIVGVVIHG